MATSWNPADADSTMSVSTTNYTNDTITRDSSSGWTGGRSTNSPAKTTGKRHFEIKVQADSGIGGWAAGIANSSEILNGNIAGAGGTNGIGFNARFYEGRLDVWFNGSAISYNIPGAAVGDIFAFEVDLDNQLIWAKDITTGTGWTDGSGGFAGNPATGSGGTSFSSMSLTGGVMIIFNGYGAGGLDIAILNPGQSTSGVTFSAPVSSGFAPWDGGAAVIADAPNPVELLASQSAAAVTRIQFLATQRNDPIWPCEAPTCTRYAGRLSAELLAISAGDDGLSWELCATAGSESRLRLESAALLGGSRDLPIALDSVVARNMAAGDEWLAEAFCDRHVAAEWLASLVCDVGAPAELVNRILRDTPGRAEWLGAVADGLLLIEWSALPTPLRVSLERLLASPGKRRLLGTPGRLRLLKRP